MSTQKDIADAFMALSAARTAEQSAKHLVTAAEAKKPNAIENSRWFDSKDVEEVRAWEKEMSDANTTLQGAKGELSDALARIERLIPKPLMLRVRAVNAPVIVASGEAFLALYMQDGELAVLEGSNADQIYAGIKQYEDRKAMQRGDFGRSMSQW